VWMLVLPNLTCSKSSFTGGMLIFCQSHHGVWACILDLATTSGDDGIDLALEYLLSGACGLLWPRPIVPGAQVTASQSPMAGNTYPLLRAPGHVLLEARVSPQVEEGGGTVRQVVKSYLPAPIVG
jgi:hypothetical protein